MGEARELEVLGYQAGRATASLRPAQVRLACSESSEALGALAGRYLDLCLAEPQDECVRSVVWRRGFFAGFMDFADEMLRESAIEEARECATKPSEP